jgi:O-6-methylguanine DNA methyltransferase
MRNYSKTGGRPGLPGYRTQASFRSRVFSVVKKIPKGGTMTYMQVAAKAGNMKAYRAVGNILNKNYDPDIPCHRVVRSDGKVGGYNRGAEKKMEILKKEKALRE